MFPPPTSPQSPGSTTLPSSSPMNLQFSTPPPSATRDRRGNPLDELPISDAGRGIARLYAITTSIFFSDKEDAASGFSLDLVCWS